MFLDSELCRSGFTVYNNYMYYACTLLCAVSISVDVAAIVVCYTPVTSLTHKTSVYLCLLVFLATAAVTTTRGRQTVRSRQLL